jgi:hypothetical protein
MSTQEPSVSDTEPVEPDAEPLEASEAMAGDPRVDAALRRAAELAATSPTEHVEIYEDIHRSLQEVLADASGPPGAAEPTEPPGESAESGDAAR